MHTQRMYACVHEYVCVCGPLIYNDNLPVCLLCLVLFCLDSATGSISVSVALSAHVSSVSAPASLCPLGHVGEHVLRPTKTCCDKRFLCLPLSISLMPVLHAILLHLLQLKQTNGHASTGDVLRQPQTTTAETWHSHTIHHGPLYTRQTTKSVSSTQMLPTKSCKLNMRA